MTGAIAESRRDELNAVEGQIRDRILAWTRKVTASTRRMK